MTDERAAPPAADHRKGPRRRGSVLEHAILAATLDELSEVGYTALTMQRVAAKARTSKDALYRRWPSRARLVLDMLLMSEIADEDVPDSGDLRGDLLFVLRQMSERMASPLGQVIRGLIGELTSDPECAALIRDRIQRVEPVRIESILARAVERGEIEPWILDSRRATVASELLRDRFLLFGAPIPDEEIIAIVDEVYLPLVLSSTPAPPCPAGTSAPGPVSTSRRAR